MVAGQNHNDPIEIAVGSLRAVTFSPNGKHLVVGGGPQGVRVWRLSDRKQIAKVEAKDVDCVAYSQDGKLIAAGTIWGQVFVWDAETYEQVLSYKEGYDTVTWVDFSPDSTRLAFASTIGNVLIFDTATRKRVQAFRPGGAMWGVKYSPQGDRIAIDVSNSVLVYDRDGGRLIVNIDIKIAPYYDTGLLWFNNHLFVVSDNKIKRFDASTGSPVSEWAVPESSETSCIAMPTHGEFIAYSAEYTVTLWDTSTHTQLNLIQCSCSIYSISISPDDQFLAIGGEDGKIVIEGLPGSTASTRERGQQDKQPPTVGDPDDSTLNSVLVLQGEPRTSDSTLHPIFSEPGVRIDDSILDLWERDHLTEAEAMLTTAITNSQSTDHHMLASRALVRARLGEWDTALVDAEKAIEVKQSLIGYIAKSMALVGKGEKDRAYRICDIAFAPFHSPHVCFLLLIKAIIVFMAGEHLDAISRVDDIIATVASNSIYHAVQAYMYLLLGNSRMEDRDYKCAIESFEYARAQVQHHTSRPPLMISLVSGWAFDDLGITTGQRLCEALYAAGHTSGAVECFRQVINELGGEKSEHLEWSLDFGKRCCEKLEHLGDTAVSVQKYDEAISRYTTALSLQPPSPQAILVKRGKAFVATGSWKEALEDANQAITLDPSSPWGYELKHAALHNAGDYDNAINALEVMLSKMAASSDPAVQQRGDQFVSPSSVRATIRRIVQRTTRHSPRVLINTTTGCLHSRADHASVFESLPIFGELVSSMTRRIDYVRIKREVREYFQYVMLSHKWEDNEPLFQQVIQTAVYDLEKSPTHEKLQMFCKIIRDKGFKWAWSDTCCIDKSDHFVLQEALVAMFRWYQGSAMMIVFLRGVRSSSQLGALVKSIWNTRAWTLQEYIASKTIHFYTEDWTLYLDLEMLNHKESQEVISEMEEATGVSAEQLIALRPGLTSIREKLRLASMRQTTLVEDTAYSLLGIFSVTGMPAIYGEGEGSLGRLLAHILTGSGDVSILAWTGESGGFNSCLPAHITVFNGSTASHLPAPIPDAEMERMISEPDSSLFDLDMALNLYDRLNELSAPWFAANRMKLPCIAFGLPPFLPYRTRSGRIYRTDTVTFGTVRIKTRYDLSRMDDLYLVHPWLDTLLEHGHKSSVMVDEDAAPLPSPDMGDEELDNEMDDDEEILDEDIDDISSFPIEGDSTSYLAPTRIAPTDKETLARRLVVRLRQPFGALLVTPAGTGRRGTDYRRVASDSLITVQLQENVSLADILENVRTLDVL